MSATVMVTGGAGYIGSHAARLLAESGRRVIVVDDLSRGFREAVPSAAAFRQLSLLDRVGLDTVFQEFSVDAVLHFAALAQVAESVKDPLRYYETNVVGTLNLLEAMGRHGVNEIVFSSTCAVYGSPAARQVEETTSTDPASPYGRSKLAAEVILADAVAASKLSRCTIFRYFNVAGSARDGSIGEETRPQTRLIPSILSAILGRRPPITVYGTDYATPDGTCIRDYVHVEDLVRAHVLALERHIDKGCRIFNLGSGRGYSVREVIEAVERTTGQSVPIEFGERRSGDAEALWAGYDRAREELGWEPSLALADMVETAWRWYRDRPNGYGRP